LYCVLVLFRGTCASATISMLSYAHVRVSMMTSLTTPTDDVAVTWSQGARRVCICIHYDLH